MRNSKLKIILLMGVSLLTAGEVFACRASRDFKHNFMITFGKEAGIHAYGTGEGSTILPQAIDKCTEEAGNYLMFSKGVFMPSLVSDVADISLDGDLPDNNKCRIENALFNKEWDLDQKKSLVRRQHAFLNKCAFINVAEMTGRPLRYRAQQKYCTVTTLGPSLVRLEGDYCFLQINPSYNLAISMGIKPECANVDVLRELNLDYGDIEATLNSYIAGDDSGASSELTPIGSSKYRFTLQAPEDLIPLSEDLGTESPRFPSIYSVNINPGELKFAPAGEERVSLDMYLSVDNTPTVICKESPCAHPSTFNVPIAAEVEIFKKLSNGRFQSIDGWPIGGIAQGNWRGLFRLPQQVIDGIGFKKGERYKVVVTMIDPYDDYYLYVARATQFLIDLRGANGVAGLDSIPSLSPLTSLAGLPPMTGLPSLSSADLNQDIEISLRYFRRLGATRLWPTYYSTLCDPSHGACFPAGKQKFWNRFTTEFDIGDLNDEGVFGLSNITVLKESSKSVVMNKGLKSFPSYTCE